MKFFPLFHCVCVCVCSVISFNFFLPMKKKLLGSIMKMVHNDKTCSPSASKPWFASGPVQPKNMCLFLRLISFLNFTLQHFLNWKPHLLFLHGQWVLNFLASLGNHVSMLVKEALQIKTVARGIPVFFTFQSFGIHKGESNNL